MQTKPKYTYIGVLGLIIFVALLGWYLSVRKPSVDLADRNTQIVSCLADKGVKFYGAYWCPHCSNQKTMFGKGVSLLSEKVYVECGELGSQGFNQICVNRGVASVPTWVFADGSTQVGEIEPEKLAQLAGCPAADGITSTATGTEETSSVVTSSTPSSGKKVPTR